MRAAQCEIREIERTEGGTQQKTGFGNEADRSEETEMREERERAFAYTRREMSERGYGVTISGGVKLHPQ
jgi:hypothetical protein